MGGKISVIVPVYQAEQYLERCIESLLNIEYQDKEIILVNDGSTDRSYEICKQYAMKHKNIVFLTQENAGVSAARNHGIKMATGDFMLFIDSDDFIKKDISDLIEQVVSKKLDIIVYGYDVMVNNKITASYNYDVFNIYNSKDEFLNHIFNLLNLNLIDNIGTTIYKSEIIKRNNIRFNPEYTICEDILFCLECINASTNFMLVPQSYYVYCFQNNGSLSSIYHNEFNEKNNYVMRYLKKMIGKHSQREFNKVYLTRLYGVLFNSFEQKNNYSKFKEILKSCDVKEMVRFNVSGFKNKLFVTLYKFHLYIFIYFIFLSWRSTK